MMLDPRLAALSDDEWLRANLERPADLESLLVPLPDQEMQQRWTGKTGDDTIAEGFRIYKVVRDFGRTIGQFGPVLDFGCGWGRVTRYFAHDLPPDQVHGVDYVERLISFCQTSNPWATFTLIDGTPPLPFEDGKFGLIYAYSVFSHLAEEMHLRWLDEFVRLLRPGGVAALSIRPRHFILACERMRREGQKTILTKMFPDTDAALSAYDRGEHVFTSFAPDATTGGGERRAFLAAYVEREWAKRFEIVGWNKSEKQPFVLLRKP